MKLDRLYEQAEVIGNNKLFLSKRLNDARSVLNDRYKKKFTKRAIDHTKKYMMSDDGSMRLQWTNRGKTSVGTVECMYNEGNYVWNEYTKS